MTEPARILLLTQSLPVVGANEVATGLRNLCGLATLDADRLFDTVLAGVWPRSGRRDRDTCVRLLVGAIITATEAYQPPALVVSITATSRYGMEAITQGLRRRGADVGHIDLAMSEPVIIERARLAWGNRALTAARAALRDSSELRPDHVLDATTQPPHEVAIGLADVLVRWRWLAGRPSRDPGPRVQGATGG